MTHQSLSLSQLYDGWDGYHTSIMHAIEPLTSAQLAWRPAPHLRSVGILASHIALGRIDWSARMSAPGSAELARQAAAVSESQLAVDHAALLHWLTATWKMISDTLTQWTVADLARTYHHEYDGQVFSVSYQWTIWRVLTHDIHHGGELALMLGQQGLAVPELGDLFGHLTRPPLITRKT